MSVYERYASGDATYPDQPDLYNTTIAADDNQGSVQVSNNKKQNHNRSRSEAYALDSMGDAITIFPLSGRLELTKNSEFKSKTTEEWINIFPNAAYFCGYDESLFGHFVVAVYENPETEKICTVSITKFGVTLYHDLILNHQSRFYPSCENLLPIHRESKVRKALAITNLKNYNKLVNHPGSFQINKRWDETNAGYLASKMNLLIDKRPNEFGNKLLQMGLLQNHHLKSYLLDIVYDNTSNEPGITEDNNKLVYLLGDQLDQLFDPLLEYSPEILETSYNTPNATSYEPSVLTGNDKISAITQELLQIQTNFTMGLVNLLQNFIIPLRIHVLTNADPKSTNNNNGISKINQIFPPTIDEITRINCVLHDSLTRAKPFGYVEIIKVFGMILPYFYKPFIRHEANLKNFKPRFDRFYGKYNSKVFSNSNINKGEFSKNYIDSIITGSLLELPKMKLVLIRLYDNIRRELTRCSGSHNEQDEISVIDYYYSTAINIIDAFGGEDNEISQQHEIDNKGHERANSRQRIFTPTGKILTELASNWPAELQYGWLTRKVIGIFELKSVKPNNEYYYDNEILIIFSDTLLFLRIVDDNYYVKENIDNNLNFLSIPDVLMHSLVNEKPLPTLSQFPTMEVSYWCSINDINVTTYKSFSSSTSSEENFLRFFDYKGNGFKGDFSNELSKNYELINTDNKNVTTGNEVIELINKAKILFKNQPFHLFRSNISNLHIYSTAHNALSYENEQIKSQIILLLNLSQEMVKHYFEVNSHLFLLFTACYTLERDVQLIAFSRTGGVEVNIVVPESDFQSTLVSHLSSFLNAYYNSFTPITELMIRSNHVDLEYYLLQYQRFNSFENRERMKLRVNSAGAKTKQKQALESSSLQKEEEQKEALETDIEHGAETRDVNNVAPQNISEVPKPKNNKKSKNSKPRRKSFIKRLFSGFKKSSHDTNISELDQSNIEEPKEKDKHVEKEYKELYRPHPKLYEPEPRIDAVRNDLPTEDSAENNGNFVPEDRRATPEIDPDLTKADVYTSNYMHHHQQENSDVQTVQHYKQESEVFDENLDAQHPNPQGFTGNSFGEDEREGAKTSKPFRELYDTSEENIAYVSQPVHQFNSESKPLKVTANEKLTQPENQEPEKETETKGPQKQSVIPSNYPKGVQRVTHNEPQSQAKVQTKAIEEAQLLFRKAREQSKAPQNREPPVNSQKQMQSTGAIPPSNEKDTGKKEPKQNHEVYDDNRVPSLDVNSQFQFPLAQVKNPEPMNVINDNAINHTETSIKDVSDSRFFPDFMSPLILDDEEANWVPMSRDSSVSSMSPDATEYRTSNNTQVETVKPDYHYDTSLNSRGDANFAAKVRDVSAADSYKSQIVNINDRIQGKYGFMQKDESVLSLTPSQYADQFSKEIDMNFSSSVSGINGLKTRLSDANISNKKSSNDLKTNLQTKNYQSTDPKIADNSNITSKGHIRNDSEEIAKRFSGMTHTSSEEEYYSLEEFPGSPIKTKTNSHSPTIPITPNANHGSFSSENTIINEMLQEHQPLSETTLKGLPRTDSFSTNSKNPKSTPNDIYIHQFDSMAYLSDVLNGKVEFND